jgi:hypothetical protein
MLTAGKCEAMTLDWSKLRYQHTAAVRAVLMEKYSPATTNKMLTALKRVLQEALKLELIKEKDYKLATDLARFRQQRVERSRLESGRNCGSSFCLPTRFHSYWG